MVKNRNNIMFKGASIGSDVLLGTLGAEASTG
jgi:hypothetical protein